METIEVIAVVAGILLGASAMILRLYLQTLRLRVHTEQENTEQENIRRLTHRMIERIDGQLATAQLRCTAWEQQLAELEARNRELETMRTINIDKEWFGRQLGGLCGANYVERTVAECTAMSPPLLCPSCNRVAAELGDATERDVVVHDDGRRTSAAPTSHVAREMAYTLRPCGCIVSPVWAGAFIAELARRARGEPPQRLPELPYAVDRFFPGVVTPEEHMREQQRKQLQELRQPPPPAPGPPQREIRRYCNPIVE